MPRAPRQNNLSLCRFEKNILPKGYKIVAGVDEAGRGPLAGPVVAAACILKSYSFRNKISDSKQLTFYGRQRAFVEIVKKADVGVGIVERELIDKINILEATIIAIKRALENLNLAPEYLLVDGRFKEGSFPYPCRTVTGGDGLCLSIACASIVAKVFRDNLMAYYALFYPEYAFGRNRGYHTQEHLSAIKKYGPTPIHRRSFQPISSYYREGVSNAARSAF